LEHWKIWRIKGRILINGFVFLHAQLIVSLISFEYLKLKLVMRYFTWSQKISKNFQHEELFESFSCLSVNRQHMQLHEDWLHLWSTKRCASELGAEVRMVGCNHVSWRCSFLQCRFGFRSTCADCWILHFIWVCVFRSF
jgi:hypothetical protein